VRKKYTSISDLFWDTLAVFVWNSRRKLWNSFPFSKSWTAGLFVSYVALWLSTDFAASDLTGWQWQGYRSGITVRRRSGRPRGLRRRSAAARLLGLRLRIPAREWMSVSCDCYKLSSRGFRDRPIPFPEGYYRLNCVCVRFRNLGLDPSGTVAPQEKNYRSTRRQHQPSPPIKGSLTDVRCVTGNLHVRLQIPTVSARKSLCQQYCTSYINILKYWYRILTWILNMYFGKVNIKKKMFS
jgi:hypothetical protein